MPRMAEHNGEAGEVFILKISPALSRNCNSVQQARYVRLKSQVARPGRFTTLSWKGGGWRPARIASPTSPAPSAGDFDSHHA